jgi:SOS-response transcriptional repressor LexA/transcriptional regulator with XRE-family HTH domain
MIDASQNDICSRIAQVRLELDGPRGKASFAKKLGLSPSTYDYYEANRMPPADVLVRIAQVANVDLRWLLTGASPATSVSCNHPAVQRAADLLAQCPSAAAPLAAFLDILAQAAKFPPKETPGQSLSQPLTETSLTFIEPNAPAAEPVLGPPQIATAGAKESWIPVLGRSAAGVPQFWSHQEDTTGLTMLGELVSRSAGRAQRRVTPARAAAEQSAEPAPDIVQIISLSEPQDENVAEFVASSELKSRHADAFAVRIDGESMAPEIRHGDLVILSPSAPAIDGRAAVVQLDGQIGVTCKLYRLEDQSVHLVPINEQFAPQVFPAQKVAWALRVLAKVRTS